MARRRRRRGNDGEQLLIGLVALVGFGIYKSGHLGQILFVLGLVCVVALVIYVFSKKRESRSIAWQRESVDYLRSPRYEGARQAINELMAVDPSLVNLEQDDSAFNIPLEWDAELLQSLEWKRFETVCTEYLRLIGYEPQETRIGADGGVDIWVYKEGKERPVGIVQCKAWTTYKVGVKPIRELYGVMAAERVANGKFITSGEFTGEAEAFAAGKRLELISGERFLAAIRKLPQEKQRDLLSIALKGDYTTPTCPQCGRKMTLRQGKRGGDRKFWGCPGFPRCRSTLVYKPAAT